MTIKRNKDSVLISGQNSNAELEVNLENNTFISTVTSGSKVQVFDKPGEYETMDIEISPEEVANEGERTARVNCLRVGVENSRILFYKSDLDLSSKELNSMPEIDVLIVTDLDQAKFKDAMEQIDPKIVAVVANKANLANLDAFLQGAGLASAERVKTLKLKRSDFEGKGEGIYSAYILE